VRPAPERAPRHPAVPAGLLVAGAVVTVVSDSLWIQIVGVAAMLASVAAMLPRVAALGGGRGATRRS
jgi:hypothetical protein